MTVGRFAMQLFRSVPDWLEDVAMMVRLTWDAPRYLRKTTTRDHVIDELDSQLRSRPLRLVAMVESTIYANPRSPFRALLQHAGIEAGDLRSLIAAEGVEGCLNVLAERGVYVTYEESKGRREIRRGSLRFVARARDFDNPLVRPHVLSHTSGSGGRPERVRRPLSALGNLGKTLGMLTEAHGLVEPEVAYWWPWAGPLQMGAAMRGFRTTGWFYPVHPLPPLVRLAAAHLRILGRLGGRDISSPVRCDLDSPDVIVDWLQHRRRLGRAVVMQAVPSAATRVALAATRAGVSLAGVAFLAVGEPMTQARRDLIESSGARVMTIYGSVEFPRMAGACASPSSPDDAHVFQQTYALTRREREVHDVGHVQALLATTLGMDAAKVALNVETGDYGLMDERDCGCALSRLGLRPHLSDIRSFEKLTGEGVTFARTRLDEIVELELPRRFGGSALDYQLAEEENATSLTRLVIRVSPSVGDVDERAVRRVMLEALARESIGAAYNASIWRAADTLEVRREAPRATRAGKVLPLQALARGVNR